jgi:hypothetical protein
MLDGTLRFLTATRAGAKDADSTAVAEHFSPTDRAPAAVADNL